MTAMMTTDYVATEEGCSPSGFVRIRGEIEQDAHVVQNTAASKRLTFVRACVYYVDVQQVAGELGVQGA